MNKRDRVLIELVHFLAHGTQEEMGLSLKETIQFLEKPINSKEGRTSLQCIDEEGRQFLNELITFINELEGKS